MMYRFYSNGVEYVVTPIIEEDWDDGVDDDDVVWNSTIEKVIGMKVIRKEEDGFETILKVEKMKG